MHNISEEVSGQSQDVTSHSFASQGAVYQDDVSQDGDASQDILALNDSIEVEPSRKRSRRSQMWSHFTYSKKDGVPYADCNYCSKSYKNPSGTGTLKTHYTKKHASNGQLQTTLRSNGTICEIQPLAGDAAANITDRIARFVIDASLPFMIVENEGFKNF